MAPSQGACAPVAGEEPHEDADGDERAGCGLAERQRVDHLPVADPAVRGDRALADVGQDGVGTAEREEAHLEEEPGDVEEAARHRLGGLGAGGDQPGAAAAAAARPWSDPPPGDEEEPAAEEHQDERQVPEEEGDEGRGGECDGEGALQGGAGDPDQGSEEQSEPHRAKAPQDTQDLGRLPVVDIDPGERCERDVAGQDEEHAGEGAGPGSPPS